jgi:hypothetical protein
LALLSLRKRVERSAFKSAVTEVMIFWSSGPSWISFETSETTSMNFDSCSRERWADSMNMVLCKTMEAWRHMASMRTRSALVNSPPFLLSTWVTPRISPRIVLTGAHNMLRVLKPVRSSTDRLNRSSA